MFLFFSWVFEARVANKVSYGEPLVTNLKVTGGTSPRVLKIEKPGLHQAGSPLFPKSPNPLDLGKVLQGLLPVARDLRLVKIFSLNPGP